MKRISILVSQTNFSQKFIIERYKFIFLVGREKQESLLAPKRHTERYK